MTGRDHRPSTSSIWKWSGPPSGHQERPSPWALADLDRRKALGPRADLTGRMMGDPPPGRSALEKKLEAERKMAEAIEAVAETDGEQA